MPDLSPGTDEGTQPQGENEAAPPEAKRPQEDGQAEPSLQDGGHPEENGEGKAAPAPEGQAAPQAGGQPGEINHDDLFREPLEKLKALGQDEYQELRLCGRRMVEHYWKFGEILVAIKQQLEHGKFIEFCRSESWDLNWVRRSMRVFRQNSTLEDCINIGVIEACHYEHVDDDLDEDEEGASTSAATPPQEDLDEDEEGDEEDLDEDKEESQTTSAATSTAGAAKDKDPGTVYNPPKWMLHHNGTIYPIDRETTRRFHKGKESFARSDGALFGTKAEAEAAFAKWRECIPKFPNCKRVLLEEERTSHPYSTTYILNDGKVVRIGRLQPPHSANSLWYTWDGETITKVEKEPISRQLYGLSTEELPDAGQFRRRQSSWKATRPSRCSWCSGAQSN